MTNNDKFIDYEVSAPDRPYYLDIDEKRIYVTEEVYRAYKQPFWAEHKRKERERRCQVSNGSGKVKRCEEDCSKCPYPKTGSAISIDRLYEEYEYEFADSSMSIIDSLVEDEFNQKMIKAVDELESIDQQIVKSFMNGVSERAIAQEIGMSQKAVNKRKNRIFFELRNKLKKYR